MAVTSAQSVEVRRSARRRRTVSAYREGGTVVVLLPEGLPSDTEQRWVQRMLERLEEQERRRQPDDEALQARAVELSLRFLQGRASPRSVRWVDNQGSRWGSCTPTDGSIRLSARLRGLPRWVLDYVLLHELAHLVEPTHGPAFWELLATYPRTDRARGFLEGIDFLNQVQGGTVDPSVAEPPMVELPVLPVSDRSPAGPSVTGQRSGARDVLVGPVVVEPLD